MIHRHTTRATSVRGPGHVHALNRELHCLLPDCVAPLLGGVGIPPPPPPHTAQTNSRKEGFGGEPPAAETTVSDAHTAGITDVTVYQNFTALCSLKRFSSPSQESSL